MPKVRPLPTGPAMAKTISYYLSYSHQDFDPYLDQFQADLSEALEKTSPLPVHGFMDRHLATGSEWSGAIVDALRSSQVMVALLSPAYLATAFAGKEWEFFRHKAGDGGAPPILPVLWAPRDTLPPVLPDALGELSIAPAGFPAVYGQEGLRFAMKLRKYRDEYQECLRLLARAVLRVAQRGAADPRPEAPTLSELPSAFHSSIGTGFHAPAAAGPRHVRCAVVAPGREQAAAVRTELQTYGETTADWRPFQPESPEPAAELVQQIAAHGKYELHPVGAGTRIVAELREAVKQGNLACMVVDPCAVRVPQLASVLREYGERKPGNTAVVVLWNEKDGETVQAGPELEAELKVLLRDSMTDDCSVVSVSSAQQMRAELAAALELLRMQTIERSPGSEVDAYASAPLERIDLAL